MKYKKSIVSKELLVLLAVATLTAFIGCPKRQTIAIPEADIIVAKDGSGDYRSISAALDHADDDDVIYVKPGTYREAVEIEESEQVTLIGAGPDKTIIDAEDEYAALTIDSDDCEVSGFALKGASSHGVYVKDGHHYIHHCLITGNGDRGIYFSSFSGEPSARIDHCTVVDNDVSGIYAPTDHEDIVITNCIIAFTGRGIVSDKDEGMMTIDNNCLFNDGEDLDKVPEGKGNIFEDPGFVDHEDGDYGLTRSSPCVGKAPGGKNLGCF